MIQFMLGAIVVVVFLAIFGGPILAILAFVLGLIIQYWWFVLGVVVVGVILGIYEGTKRD